MDEESYIGKLSFFADRWRDRRWQGECPINDYWRWASAGRGEGGT